MNPLVFVPGAAMLLLTALELPKKAKKAFFRVPVWVSSSVIALFVGVVGRGGVFGPLTGFTTEIILFPGLHLAKKHFLWTEARLERRANKVKERKEAEKMKQNIKPLKPYKEG